MVPDNQVHLRLFGAFAVARDPAFATGVRVSSKKGCALLAYLAMCPQQSATRDVLATLLWGSSPDQQARQSLRQTLLLLRKDLAPAKVIDAGPDVVRLEPGTVCADGIEFEALSGSEVFEDLERAAVLARDDFLTGMNLDEEAFEDWLRHQRHRFETAATSVLERYARECDRREMGQQAIAAAERLLGIGGPLREDWQRLALRLYARYRSANEALAQARMFADLLRRELDVEPEPETRNLIDEIRRGSIPPIVTETVGVAPAPSERGSGVARTPPPGPTPDQRGLLWLLARPFSAALAQRRTIGRGSAAAGVIILLVAAALLANGRYVSAPAPKAATISFADPWQSPSLPSHSNTELEARRPKALVPVVVLPFKTYGETAGSMLLLADMMTDDLINILSRVPSLRVISRATSRSYQGQIVDPAVIGADLKVRYILDGSMRMHAGKLRVNVELIDPKTKLAVWSGRIEREQGDRHGVQDEIVGRLARELQFELYPIESERLAGNADADALAYRGWAAMNAGYAQSSADAFSKALSLFNRALERQPGHVGALMGVGAYHANMGAQRLDREPKAHLDKAFNILQQVARQAPSSGMAHHLMGLILQLTGKLPEALESLQRAVEINPSSAGSYAHIGHTLTRMGKSAEGLDHVLYAIRLSPRDPNLAYWLEFAGCSELELGRFQPAIDYFARSRALNPGYPRSLAGLVAAHALAGNESEARVLVEKLRTLAPDLPTEEFIDRYSRMKNHIPRLREGLRLALNLLP